MAELSPTPTTAHGIACNGIGKFDCSFDEHIYGLTLDESVEGDAEAPTGWWVAIDIDAECEGHPDDDSTVNEAAGGEHTCDGSCSPNWPVLQHYQYPWLIVSGNEQGFVYVTAFPTEELRDTMVGVLETQFNEWYDGDGDQL